MPLVCGLLMLVEAPVNAAHDSSNKSIESPQSLAQHQPVSDRTDPNTLAAQTESGAMEQVTSVSQLSDVQPTDWAYQALQVLVKRYGVLVSGALTIAYRTWHIAVRVL